MQLDEKQIKRIMEKHKEDFAILEEYDKTHELPTQRKRIDITLLVRAINKLKRKKQASLFPK